MFELNRSGKYLQIMDTIKAAVLEIVQEQYKKSGPSPGGGEGEGVARSPEEDRREALLLHHKLFAQLLDEMHAALASLKTPPAPPPTPQVIIGNNN